MARVYVSSVIGAAAAKVWLRVRDFNGLPNWHPAIAESRIEGGEPACIVDGVGAVCIDLQHDVGEALPNRGYLRDIVARFDFELHS